MFTSRAASTFRLATEKKKKVNMANKQPWEDLLEQDHVQDNVLFSVCRIFSEKIGTIGTGFFYSPKKEVVFLVTAGHVIDCEDEDTLFFAVRVKGSGCSSREIRRQSWVIPNREVDLAACNVTDIFRELFDHNGCRTLPRTWISSDELLLKKFTVVTPIALYGYPTGLYDPATEFPLVRTGHTAAHPGLKYNHLNEGRMNIANYEADSGAPVLILHEVLKQHHDNTLFRGTYAILLGIHHEGFSTHTSYGLNIPPEDAGPEEQLVLGSFIKASELFDILEWE